jgi:peptidoglycan hydrolase CwlO-like protein
MLKVRIPSKRTNFTTIFTLTLTSSATLAPRRNNRTALETQIGKIESGETRVQNPQAKIAELRSQLDKLAREDDPQERENESLKRRGIRDSEGMKWQAIREVRFASSR